MRAVKKAVDQRSSDPIDAWVEAILRERIGLPLRLVRVAPDVAMLSIEGADATIEFQGRFEWVTGDSSAIPCARFDTGSVTWLRLPAFSLVLPGRESAPVPLITQRERSVVVRYDLPRMLAWVLSRAEEVGCSNTDEFGRFPVTAAHAYRHSYLERPVVDEWLSVVRVLVSSLLPAVRLVDNRFTIALSHDVDQPARYAFRQARGLLAAMAGDVVRRRVWKDMFAVPAVRMAARRTISAKDPYNTFHWIMSESERRSLASAFYFICGNTSPSMDADYDVEHPAIRDLIRQMHARGHEIGLHPSFGSYLKPETIANEARRLHEVCAQEGVRQDRWGGRMHFLRWVTPTTAHGWELAGMHYDSTLGFAEQPGFRCGTCYEYPMFDPVAGREMRVRARPLIAMDVSVTSDQYLGLGSGECAFRTLKSMKDACRQVGGTFTLLWHNSELVTESLRNLYLAVLDA